MEAWQKVFINQESFFETMHGRYGCITCHGGTGGSDDKETAHEGIVREPDSEEACGDCHADQVATDGQSLHTNLNGYSTALAARGTGAIETMRYEDSRCATPCGAEPLGCSTCSGMAPKYEICRNPTMFGNCDMCPDMEECNE